MLKTDFKVGHLVRSKLTKDIGRALDVDPDYYGARQAFKVYGAQKGQAIRPGSENGIGPTKHGIRDKVLVRWYTSYLGLEHSLAEWMDGKDLILLETEEESEE
tara:strand:+ start:47 stop:355 length:309 start_codon:yes stop_codon:yes gene_type:complete